MSINRFKRDTFLSSKSAAGAGEYGLIAALIAVLGLVAVTSTGTSIRDVFNGASTSVQEAGTSTTSPPPSGPQSPTPGDNFAITLGGSSLPQANPGIAYSFDFSSLVALTDPGTVTSSDLTWTSNASPDTIPAGLTLNPTTGILSGTPDPSTANTSASFEIVGSFAGQDGQQVYTLNVGGVIIQVTQIAAGDNHTCAVTANGAAMCWGNGGSGQLGNGGTSNQTTPVQVSGLSSGAASISAGNFHTCAVTTSGQALCWGLGGSGKLGNGDTSQQNTPVDVVWD